MSSVRDLTLTEAAYLASACLTHESRSHGAVPIKVLFETALSFDPLQGPVSIKMVHRAIADGFVRSRKSGSVLVDEYAVFFLAGIKLANKAAELTPDAKGKLSHALKGGEATVTLSPYLSFETGSLVKTCRRLVNAYAKSMDDWIVEDAEVMGGVPCIRGTRIPVHTVLGRIEEGESFDEISKDFDHIHREGLQVALAYARTHPRRGRPKQFR